MMSTGYSWITKAKTIAKSRYSRRGIRSCGDALNDLIPSPGPPAVSPSRGFSLLEICPFWLSGLCMEMGPKYQKTHITHRLSSSSYWTTCWKEGEKENLDLLPLLRMGFQSQNIVQRSFSPLVFQLGSANPLRGHPGQRQQGRRSERAKLQAPSFTSSTKATP